MLKFNKKVKLKLLGVALFCAVTLGVSGCKSSDDSSDDPVVPTTDAGSYTLEADILPLFTTKGAFVTGIAACTSCHDGLTATSAHEMDLSSYAGIISGADSVSAPPGVSILGQKDAAGASVIGDPLTYVPDWGKSKMRERLRNNRMPPGAWDANDESNRDTFEINALKYWIDNGATEALWNTKLSTLVSKISGFPTSATLQGDVTIGELFTTKGAFVKGAAACDSCHSGVSGGDHEMDLTSYAGIFLGADSASAPPGVSILGQSTISTDASTTTWSTSKLRERLRNNRMPPAAWDHADEANRDTAQINLVRSWVEAGAPETDNFNCYSGDKADCTGDPVATTGTYGTPQSTYTFADDVLPLFTEKGAFVAGVTACTGCHDGLTATSAHEMDLGTYAGIIAGADSVSSTAVSILGQTTVGTPVTGTDTATDWAHSKMRERLRNNRMPPGAWDDADETNRDTIEIKILGKWVTDGALEAGTTSKVGYDTALNTLYVTSSGDVTQDSTATAISDYAAATYATAQKTMWSEASTTLKSTGTVADLFKTKGVFVKDALACTSCHDGLTATSAHEMDLGTYAGIIAGADSVTATAVSILGQTTAGAVATNAVDWSHSKLRERLRNNRMPAGGWDPDTETNRDTPQINLVGAWIEAGAPETDSFACTTGKVCASGKKN